MICSATKIAFAILAACTFAPANAAQASSNVPASSSKSAAELGLKIVQLMNGDQRWKGGIEPLAMVIAVSAANEIEQGKDDQTRKLITALPGGKERFLRIVADKFTEYLTSQSELIREEAAALYSHSFSTEEMTEIIAFLQTPVGTKWMGHMTKFDGALGIAFDKDQKRSEEAMLSALTQVRREVEQAESRTKSDK